MRRLLFFLCLLTLLSVPFRALTNEQSTPKPGNDQLLIVDGYFNYVQGAWASYKVDNLQTNESYLVRFATLEREPTASVPAYWMEILVEPQNSDPVVTRFLVADTPKGPGQPLEVIVQPRGMAPFIVPDSFLESSATAPENVISPSDVGKPKRATIKVGKKRYKGWHVKANDGEGRPVSAVVSEEIPPLGLVRVESEKLKMMLYKFGSQARSDIEGEPVNFYLWLTMQIGQGLLEQQ